MAIDYTRRDRATPPRNLVGHSDPQSALQGKHSQASAQSSRAATQSIQLSTEQRHGSLDQAHRPSLLVVDDQLTKLRPIWHEIEAAVGNQSHAILSAHAAAHPDLTAILLSLFKARESLGEAFRDHLGGGTGFPDSGDGARTANQWISAAHELRHQIEAARVPWTSSGRERLKAEFAHSVRSLTSSFFPTVSELIVTVWKQMDDDGKQATRFYRQENFIRSHLTMPWPPVGPPVSGSADTIVSGLGPLNIFLGTLRATLVYSSTSIRDITITGYDFQQFNVWNRDRRRHMKDSEFHRLDAAAESHVGYPAAFHILYMMMKFASTAGIDEFLQCVEADVHSEQFSEVELPVVVDLDRLGSFLINTPSGIETAVLNLLAALPANQLLIRVFDPEKAGESANFLYGLGEAQEKVIGQSVRTSPRQLDELLQETEEHITFVTQRYLQGEHSSLTDYNNAAGEVAEPYRIIILYDFPAGFSRAGHHDVDQLDRLGRIIQNGPRTGVFTILVSNEMENPGPEPEGADDGTRALLRVTSSVPHLHAGDWLTENCRNKLESAGGGVRLPHTIPAPPVNGLAGTVSEGIIRWIYTPAAPPSDAVARELLDAVKRGISNAEDVVVTPARVFELAAQQERETATTNRTAYLARTPGLDRPETWWQGNSTDDVTAHFGRIGARQTADLMINSETHNYGALIGGRPGSGKSVLIHAVIMSLGVTYSPAELELYLVDFKEGVEFKQYADLGMPQARLVAIEAERDFGLSILVRAQLEYQRRSKLFKGVTGPKGEQPAKISDYRKLTGHALPRYVVIIDEFQQLFTSDDKIAQQAAEVLEDLLRKGRAFGVHIVLASQSLAGMAALGKHVIGLMPVRIALQSNESDSRLILGDDNADAQTLSRAGEGIINCRSGQRDANRRFQAALWSAEARGEILKQLAKRAEHDGFTDNTAVFDGHSDAEVGGLSRATLGQPDTDPKRLDLPLGQPLILDAEPYRAQFKRTAGSNLLIVDEHGAGTLGVLLASLTLRGVPVDLIDYETDHDDWSPVVEDLEYVPGVTVERRRGMRALLEEVAKTVDTRHATDSMREPTRVLVIAGMARARDFDPNSYDDDDPGKILARILTDGPEVGVHVIIWFDNPGGIRKRLGSNHIDECGLRVIGPMGRDDSTQLIDNSDAATLKSGQVIVADVDRSTSVKVRRFGAPPTGWIAGLRHE